MVFAEGKKTEVIYLNHWNKMDRQKMILKIAPHVGSAPMTVVREAARVKKLHLKEQKGSGAQPYNEYWCVLDVDEHEDLPNALQCALDNGISVALSNPCLEIWFLFHFDSETKWLHRDEAQKRAYDHLRCTKSTFGGTHISRLFPQYETARKHAKALEIKHADDGVKGAGNPSSNIWKLIDIIRTGKPCDAEDSGTELGRK
ncbi:RloB family protein [Nocardia aurea]|uniref:RloB family protein n=1 Tax=Nocardia aurea TaxID=2144174 RepID=A0ABV3G3R6_9NOCA